MSFNESLDSMAYRAELKDDRKEYALKKKHGKKYKDFVSQLDDKEEYKRRMKYGEKGE